MLRRVVSVMVAFGAMTLSSAAFADEADDLIARGLDLREKGKDDEALALFRKALTAAPTPRARAQVALAEQALGMWVMAESDLLAALESTTDAWITKNRAALDGALATVRKHLGSLEVRGTDGAEILLDGVKLGTLPTSSFRAEAGTRILEVRAKGFQSTTRQIDVPIGGIARESVNLATAPVADTQTSPPREKPIATAGSDPGRGQRFVGWAFVVTGGVLVGGGIASAFVRQGIISDYNDACPGVGAASQTPECNDKIDSTKTWKTVSIISLVAGGAFAVGGLVIVLTAPKAEKSAANRFGCAPSFGGVVCAGRFGFF